MILNNPCSRCKNSIPIDGSYGMPRCKAFPNGIPYSFYSQNDVTQLDECNNGYKFEDDGEALLE